MARNTIVALFDDYRNASAAIAELERAGIRSADISIVANNLGNRYGSFDNIETAPHENAAPEGAGIGAALGAAAAGGAGLLAGIGALTIPGLGPLIAAGALVSTLVGVGAGAAAGALVGSLVGAGISREHADIYAEAVRRGGTLITVRAEDAERQRVCDIVERHDPVDVDERSESWRHAEVPQATTTTGAPADHGASAGVVPMPTGSGVYAPPSGEWQVRREGDTAAMRDAARPSPARVRVYPIPEGVT